MEPDTLVWMRVIEVLDRSDGYDLDHFYVAILPGGGCVRSRGHEGDQSPDGLARAMAPFPWDEQRPFTPPVTTGGEKGRRCVSTSPTTRTRGRLCWRRSAWRPA